MIVVEITQHNLNTLISEIRSLKKEIIDKLEEIRCQGIDIETAIEKGGT